MKKLKEIIASPYLIAALFVGKMAVYYSLIKVNQMEIVMIVLSLVLWAALFICFGRSGLKRKRGIFLVVYFLLSLLMFADTMYYNYYNQTVSIRQLWQAKSVTAVPKSFIATMIPASFLLFLDIPFAYHSFKKYASRDILQKIYPWRKLKYLVYVLTAVIITLIVNPFHSAAIERVNSMEFFTSHVTDIYETISDNLDQEEMQQEEILEVLEQVAPEPQSPLYQGIGKGKNLIVIQLEAVQDFVIGAKYQGQEITPNLNRLKELLDIPVFHDDQHGTAIVVLAAAINALKVTGKGKEECKIVVNGAGSAGLAISKLLLTYGFKHLTLCDINGILSSEYKNLNWMQEQMLNFTNLENKTGTLADALVGADLFVGVSAPNIVTEGMVASMNQDAIILAMANPTPEIMPDLAKKAGARIVATGRSDFPNQVNNVVAFPGIFCGALEGRASQITDGMKLAAAEAIAALVSDEELREDNIMPQPFDPRVCDVVSAAVKANIRRE
jgi:hypothetical protein